MSSEYEFLQDTSRFLRRHFNLVAQWPLQIYSSALIFSPKSSILRSENLSKLPTYFRVLPDVGDDWEYLLHTMYTERVWCVSFSPDGKQFASGSSSGSIKLWNATTGDCKLTLRIGHSSRILAVAFSPDGTSFAAASDDRTIRVYDTASSSLERLIRTSESRLEYTRSLIFSQDGSHIISGSMYGFLSYWDATTGDVRKALKSHSGPVNAIDISRDGKYLASGSSDRTVKLWNAVTGGWKMTIEGHSGPVQAVSFSADSMTLVSGSYDKTLKSWNIATGSLLNTIERHSSPVCAVKFSPSGSVLASCASDGYLRISDAATGAHLQTFVQGSEANRTIDFSPNGRILVMGSSVGNITIWETATFDLHETTVKIDCMVDQMVISPDGNLIATFSFFRNLFDVRDAKTGRFRASFEGHAGSIQCLAFSHDSKNIVSRASDGIIKLWDVGDVHQRTLGQCGQAGEYGLLRGYERGVNVLICSPDGKWIALGFDGNRIGIWDSITGKALRVISSNSLWVSAAAFSPDSTKIATSYADGTVKIWDLTPLAKPLKICKVPLHAVFKMRPEREITTFKEIGDLEFSTDMRYLLTDGGLISLEDSVPGPDNSSVNLLKFYVKDGWICYGTIPFLRILNGGRLGMCYAAQGDRVLVGYETFQLFIFEIDRGILQSALQSSGFWMDQNALLK